MLGTARQAPRVRRLELLSVRARAPLCVVHEDHRQTTLCGFSQTT